MTADSLPRPGVLGRAAAVEQRPPVGDLPWSQAHLRAAALLPAAGLTGIVVCWYGTSSSTGYERQLLWLAFSLISLATAAAGGVVHVLVGMREVRGLRRRVLQRVTARLAVPMEAPATDGQLVTGSSMTRYHRPDCPFVRSKDVDTCSRRQAERRRRTACEVCRP